MPTLVDIKDSPIFSIDGTEFTIVRFLVELPLFLVRQNYHSLENSYWLFSLACSVLCVNSKYLLSVH
jgi:hypothetical protein